MPWPQAILNFLRKPVKFALVFCTTFSYKFHVHENSFSLPAGTRFAFTMIKANGLLLPLIFFFLVASSVLVTSVTEQRFTFSRPDPLRGFKPYNGEFDIRDRHYWSSLVFTGVHGYATAGIWLLGGLGFGIFILKRSMREEPGISGHSDCCSFFPFLIILLLTLLVIVVSGIIVAANQSFNKRAKKLIETVEETVVDVRKNIRAVTGAVDNMHLLLREYDEAASSRLNLTSEELQYQSRVIRRVVHENRRSIGLAIHISNGVTLGAACAALVLVVGAFVVMLLRWRLCFITIMFICLLLTALCWVLEGLEFVEFTLIRDACSALEEYTKTPDENSLRSMLPCLNLTSADAVMSEIGLGVHTVISQVNSKIRNVHTLLPLVDQAASPQGGFRFVCDPFSEAPDYRYDPKNCSKDTIPISDVPKVLNRLECPEEETTITCDLSRKFLSGTSIDMAKAYSQSIQGIIDVLPELYSLTHCSFLEDTFSDILHHQCKPLKSSIRLLWTSMLALSVSMVVLVIVWILKARRRS